MSDDLEYNGYRGSIEFSREDRLFFGKVLFIDSLLMFHGASVDELEAAFKETVDRYLDHCKRAGRTPNKPYSGSFNVRVGQERHKAMAEDAYRRKIKSLNDYICQAVDVFMTEKAEQVVNHNHHHHGEVSFRVTVEQDISVATPVDQVEEAWALH